MAVISVVKLSKLGGTTGMRMDSEYYDPKSIEIENRLKRMPHTTIKNLRLDVDGSAFYPSIAEHYQTSGVPFLRVSDITDGFLKIEDTIFLPTEIVDKFSSIRKAYPRDIVITKGGSVGIATILPDMFNRYALSRDLIVIRTSNLKDEEKVVSILLFLISKYGKSLLLRGKSQQVQPHLTLPLVRELLIPRLETENVVKIYREALTHFQESKTLYSQAETLLLEEFGFGNFKPKYEKTYTAKLSDAFSIHRIDAEYFQPAYVELIENIKNYRCGFDKLLKHVENVEPNFDPTKYPEESFCYVELADIDSSIGVIQNTNDIEGQEAPSRARRILKKNDVIVSSVEGSLEKVALVDKEHDGCLASTGFFQFRPLKILPEVLLILSKTPVLQLQLKKKCSGTILTAIPKKSLDDIVIPLLPFSTQQKTASLIQKSHEARKKAKELLDAAKKAVEIAIEKGENDAFNYLSTIKSS